MYDYLVAYNFSSREHLGFCCGTIHLSRKKKIKTFQDLIDVNKCIAEQITGEFEGATNVNVYNFILLGRNKH
jgi:hypothetical protein